MISNSRSEAAEGALIAGKDARSCWGAKERIPCVRFENAEATSAVLCPYAHLDRAEWRRDFEGRRCTFISRVIRCEWLAETCGNCWADFRRWNWNGCVLYPRSLSHFTGGLCSCDFMGIAETYGAPPIGFQMGQACTLSGAPRRLWSASNAARISAVIARRR